MLNKGMLMVVLSGIVLLAPPLWATESTSAGDGLSVEDLEFLRDVLGDEAGIAQAAEEPAHVLPPLPVRNSIIAALPPPQEPVCVSNHEQLMGAPQIASVAGADFYTSTFRGNGIYHSPIGQLDAVLTVRMNRNGSYTARGCAQTFFGERCRDMDRGRVRLCLENGKVLFKTDATSGERTEEIRAGQVGFTIAGKPGQHSDFKMKKR